MILIDTDILVDFLRDIEKSNDFIEKHTENICISNLTRLELLTGAKNKKEMLQIDKRLIFPVLSLNETIEDIATDIIKKHYLKDGIGIVDSLIAATTIYYNVEFYSKNIKHYRYIKNLKLKKPY
jgi:tRNA(fMet)-specific endonuclease VapC